MEVTKSISINAPAFKVWQVLTDPKLIKIYLFGTQVDTDWKPGSPIVFSGNWHGTPFVDKGNVLKVDTERLLQYSYWSSVLGLPDTIDNYTITTYSLSKTGDTIILGVTQSNLESQPKQVQEYAGKYWEDLLKSIKDFCER